MTPHHWVLVLFHLKPRKKAAWQVCVRCKSTSSNITFVLEGIRNVENRSECDDLCDRSVAFCFFSRNYRNSIPVKQTFLSAHISLKLSRWWHMRKTQQCFVPLNNVSINQMNTVDFRCYLLFEGHWQHSFKVMWFVPWQQGIFSSLGVSVFTAALQLSSATALNWLQHLDAST